MPAVPYLGVKILLIDDDPEFRELMREYLELNSFSLTAVPNGQEGLTALASGGFDLVLLDMFLPDINGLDVLRLIRQSNAVPVVILSAHNEETDRIIALEIGADDYVPKTFSSRELLAHIRAVLRRHGRGAPDNAAFRNACAAPDGDGLRLRALAMNNRTREAFLAGEPLQLTASEFQMLYVMVDQAGRVFTREDLLGVVAERDFNKFDRSVDVHISSLRHKLGDDSNAPQYIRTLRGVGYSVIP